MADILFIKTSSLGDVIHHMPALTEARRNRPDARFAWVVEEAYAPLLALMSFLSNAQAAPREVTRAVCFYFGSYCRQALRVAYCETGGTYSIYARNGQYLGLFQVSAYWRRAIPGWHPHSAWGQARHAYRVFRLTGSNWSHWSCKP